MKKSTIIVFNILIVVIPIVLKLLFNFNISDSILTITALIILWYTYETARIARLTESNQKIIEENQLKQKTPSVSCRIYTNPDDKLDTIIDISNLSDYPVAIKLNCNFKLNGESLDYDPAYNGQHYWNLQYKQDKQGNFSYLDLLKKVVAISSEEYANIKRGSVTEEMFLRRFLTSKKKLSMDLEIFAINEMGLKAYYPPTHYHYSYKKKVWIPILTSDKPYWEYDSEPEWIKNN